MSIIDHLCGAFGALPVRALRQLSVECKKGVEELEPKVDAIVKEYEDAKNLAAAVEKAIADKDAERCLKDTEDDVNWREVVDRWNKLAAEQKLTRVELNGFGTARKKRYRARIKDDPNFWENLADAVKNKRSPTMRHSLFPSFDQATKPAYYEKLLAGGYAVEFGGEQKKSERVSSFGGAAETS